MYCTEIFGKCTWSVATLKVNIISDSFLVRHESEEKINFRHRQVADFWHKTNDLLLASLLFVFGVSPKRSTENKICIYITPKYAENPLVGTIIEV